VSACSKKASYLTPKETLHNLCGLKQDHGRGQNGDAYVYSCVPHCTISSWDRYLEDNGWCGCRSLKWLHKGP
jgi:hypothetical protein